MANTPNAQFQNVCRANGLTTDQERAFHDYLDEIQNEDVTDNMSYEQLFWLCKEWKTSNPSYDKHTQRGGGRSGQSESTLDRNIKSRERQGRGGFKSYGRPGRDY